MYDYTFNIYNIIYSRAVRKGSGFHIRPEIRTIIHMFQLGRKTLRRNREKTCEYC